MTSPTPPPSGHRKPELMRDADGAILPTLRHRSHFHEWKANGGTHQELMVTETWAPNGLTMLRASFDEPCGGVAADYLLALVADRMLHGARLVSMDGTSAVLEQVADWTGRGRDQ